jgi:sarcosine oxidase
MAAYDVIVLGLGAMGSAAAFHVAQRGRRVLGLDAYEAGHTRGASHGRTRAIREAHFEAPEYVPLVQRAYVLWRDLEAASGRRLLTITGGLSIGPPDSPLVRGVLTAARAHGLAHDYLTPAEMAVRFPGFRLTDDLVAVREANAGILEQEACLAAHRELAGRHGADMRHAEPVLRWLADGAGVRVETARGTYMAEKLVVTAGPWAGEVLAELSLSLTNWRAVSVQFKSIRPELFQVERCPQYFKFASVMGEVLADLALDGATRHPIGFLSADRFAASGPEPT